MKRRSSLTLAAAGLTLLLSGFLLLFFMVIRLVEPAFYLSFLAYTACSTGLILGITGIMRWRR
ncbi:hypothetical protein ACFLT8_01290 [Chloroflexota bacterium]